MQNKRKIVVRVIRMGAIYMISGPALAVAAPMVNATAISEAYRAAADSCLGNKLMIGKGFFYSCT